MRPPYPYPQGLKSIDATRGQPPCSCRPWGASLGVCVVAVVGGEIRGEAESLCVSFSRVRQAPGQLCLATSTLPTATHGSLGPQVPRCLCQTFKDASTQPSAEPAFLAHPLAHPGSLTQELHQSLHTPRSYSCKTPLLGLPAAASGSAGSRCMPGPSTSASAVSSVASSPFYRWRHRGKKDK